LSNCVVVDLASSAVPIINGLMARGVTTVFRYYAAKYQSAIPEKRLTVQEQQALFAAGLSVGIAYQYNNSVLSNFNRAKGRDDAQFCVEYASGVIRQPPRTAIYFGVDGDWSDVKAQQKICSYFEAIAEVFSAAQTEYLIGVYGSGQTCERLALEKLATLFWLPPSWRWSGTQRFYNSGGWHIFQNRHDVSVDGRLVDTNIINTDVTSIGTFNVAGAVAINQPKSVFHSRRFPRTADVALRTGPSLAHPIAGVLKHRRTVRVLNEADGWALLDVDEDARADGYATASDLQPLDQMP
jgi:hypothetical protein